MQDITRVHIEYFDLINSFFGGIKHHLGKEADSHLDFGVDMANYPLISDLIVDAVDDLRDEITDFWRRNAKIALDTCSKQDTLKCIYSGDITPIILENFVKKSALYLDTVIIADPILNLTLMQEHYVENKKYYLSKLLRHVFNIFRMKDLLTSNSNECTVAVLPTTFQILGANERKNLFDQANSSFITYFNSLFGKELQTIENIFSFAADLSTSDQILSSIRNVEFLPNKFKNSVDLSDFLGNFSNPHGASSVESKGMGWDFCLYIQSQFVRVQEHIYFCKRMNAEPIYDYELPWFWFNYEMGGLNMDAAIANSLQQEKFKWITKVPLEAITVFRGEKRLEYMRSILRQSLHDLKTRTDDVGMTHTCEQIESNLNEAFARQNSEIRALEADVAKIMKRDIPITTGGFLAGLIPVFGNVVSFLTAGRDIRNFILQRNKLKREIKNKQGNFINLLLKSSE
jgi:hypothetical protein